VWLEEDGKALRMTCRFPVGMARSDGYSQDIDGDRHCDDQDGCCYIVRELAAAAEATAPYSRVTADTAVVAVVAAAVSDRTGKLDRNLAVQGSLQGMVNLQGWAGDSFGYRQPLSLL